MENCKFCEAIESDGGLQVDENKNCVSILSNPALVEGHCLVIPKRHVGRMSELDEEEKKDFIEMVVKMQEKALKNFEGCDLRQNYRPFLEDSRFNLYHLHFHIQPREFKDELYEKCQKYEDEVFRDLSDEEINRCKEIYS